MKTVTISRKPLLGTSARTALEYGTGGLNIDLSRIGDGSDIPAVHTVRRTDYPQSYDRVDGAGWGRSRGGLAGDEVHWEPKGGRWPANVILTAASAKNIDEQAGVTRSGIRLPTGGSVYPTGGVSMAWNANSVVDTTVRGYNDEGGVSRYFKQVGDYMNGPPQDLINYLSNMIGTPELPGVYWDLAEDGFDDMLAALEDDSVQGVVLNGQPTEAQSAELMRVLMPGAYLLAIAPDDEPTNHTAACRIEDAGFEIRDSILLAQEGSKLHYVPKAGRKEREEGCGHLKGKAGHEAVGREQGSAGAASPSAGAGRTANVVKNFHPTVKPIALMERLLEDIPKGSTVLDPFMGSGSTGCAAVKLGYSFVGIEMGEEYIEIADARIQHHGAPRFRAGAKFISDHEPASPEEESETVDLFVFFGGDE